MFRILAVTASLALFCFAAPDGGRTLTEAISRSKHKIRPLTSSVGSLEQTWVAPSIGYSATFDANGTARLNSAAGNGLSVRLESINRRSLSLPTSRRMEEDRGGWSRAVFQRAEVEERYTSTSTGVEHSFVVQARPTGNLGNLTLRLQVTGMETRSLGDDAIEVRTSERPVFTYSGIRAWDADGRTLPAQLGADGTGILLQVDDLTARYPVTIDPTWLTVDLVKAATPSNGAVLGDAVALDGDRAIVAAPYASFVLSELGAVYIFERDGTGAWREVASLLPPYGAPVPFTRYGEAVALKGDYALIGAPGYANVPVPRTGLVQILKRSAGGVWQWVGSNAYPFASNWMQGASVALGQGVFASGAPQSFESSLGIGRISVYRQAVDETWAVEQDLVPSDGVVGQSFGASVALSGDLLVGGSPNAAVSGMAKSGAAYVFERSGGTWTQVQKLVPDEPRSGGTYGYRVGIIGTRILVAEPSLATTSRPEGRVFVYERGGDGMWSRTAILTSSDSTAGDLFGSSVVLDATRIIVGAPTYNGGTGAVYIFEQGSGGAWQQTAKLTSPYPGAGLGKALALSGRELLAGIPVATIDGFVGAGGALLFRMYDAVPDLSFDVPWRTGGKPVNMTVSLASTAIVDTPITLSGGGSILTLPAQVVVPAGSRSISISVPSATVASDATVTVRGTVNDGSYGTASVEVRSPRVGRVDVGAASLYLGRSTTVTAVLNGPAPAGGTSVTFSLPAGSPLSLSQSSVTIPAGGTRATVTATATFTASEVDVVVSAGPAYVPKSGTIRVLSVPIPSVTVPASVEVAGTANCFVRLSRAMPSNTLVSLTYSGPLVGPTQMVVPAGMTSVPFPALATTMSGTATITATASGASTTSTILVQRPVLLSVALSPTTTFIGGFSIATVTLEKPAPEGGVVLFVSLDLPRATVTNAVTIPAGTTTTSFLVYNALGTVKVLARTRTGGLKGATLTVL